MDKYFLEYAGEEEQEVTREEWILAERGAGFYPKMDSEHPDYYKVTATNGFSTSGIWGKAVRGRIEKDNSNG